MKSLIVYINYALLGGIAIMSLTKAKNFIQALRLFSGVETFLRC